jgi:glycosyltransferase involved in cell wall biosynthesis
LPGTIDSHRDDAPATVLPVAAIVAAHDEADRIVATLTALALAFPGTALWVADDGSTDGTAEEAAGAGARLVRSPRDIGKGAAMTLAVREALEAHPGAGTDVFLLCDGDLGESAARLGPLAEAVRAGGQDLAVALFARPVGGGFGIALGFAAWAIRSACGLRAQAPISGPRALRRATLEATLPFAGGYGMEIGMTIDAVRAGARVAEIQLDLSHRPTGRTLAGFLHRARQLSDFARAYARRR